ncbi:hypothetical protein [Fluviispira sanaruensis]|uniref:Uracil-DNA glycosylase-like domain-containing protein n=1 Tax=Fluviispira sanaruensis TaxID=2493639 RepID=A0A4P2VMQ8_FLUSA|nr:hypothetical protein [Fluviispira sanaruensis]BBH52769.1 hypothetical protein JCM31447_12120 [Fluviispira sanaruensis]
MDIYQKVQRQIRDKIYTCVSEGVERFPQPLAIYNSDLLDQEKRYLILTDFFENDEHLEEGRLSDNDLNKGIIINLLGKLGIYENSYFVPPLILKDQQTALSNKFSNNINPNLLRKIIEISPYAILCFGHRSLLVLSAIFKDSIALSLNENLQLEPIKLSEGKSSQLFYLSSIKDLSSFPIWRKQVWQVLLPLSCLAEK